MDWEKGSKGHATAWGSKYISKGLTPLKPFSWSLRQGQQTLKNGIIYRFKCPHINCPGEYIGESGGTLRDRFKEHLKDPSLINHHSQSTGHTVSPECFTVVDRVSPGTLRNLGKYQFPCIWDIVLQDTPSLQLK